MGKVRELLSSSSVPGVSQSAASKSICQIIAWIVASLACLSIFIYSSIGIIMTFSEDNIATTVNMDSGFPVQFPAVTICNINPFGCTKLKNYSGIINIKGLAENCRLGGMLQSSPTRNQRRRRILNEIFDLGRRERSDLGEALDSLIPYCLFNNEPCSKKDFKLLLHPQYGNCYTFRSVWAKSGAVATENRTAYDYFGPDKGLVIYYNINRNEYIHGIHQEEGLRIVIHDPHVIPNIEHEGFDIFPGISTSVGFQQRIFKRINASGKNCQSEIHYGNHEVTTKLKKPHERYHQMRCFAIYNQLETISKCGCRDVELPGFELFNKTRSCDYVEKSKVQEMNKCRSAILLNIDNTLCERQCNELQYQTFVTITKWPSTAHLTDVLQELNISRLNNVSAGVFQLRDIGKLTIYQRSVMTETVSESLKFTHLTLISNVGGLAGLYLGVSFLTIFEIFDVIFRAISWKSKRTKSPDVNPA